MHNLMCPICNSIDITKKDDVMTVCLTCGFEELEDSFYPDSDAYAVAESMK